MKEMGKLARKMEVLGRQRPPCGEREARIATKGISNLKLITRIRSVGDITLGC